MSSSSKIVKRTEPVYCKICQRSVQRISWKRHLQCHEEGRFLCDICGVYRVRRESMLRKHKKSVHNVGKESIYDCLFCKKKTGSFAVLSIHLRSHTKERPYICKICSSECCHLSGLKAHEERVHGGKGERNFKCSTCAKCFFDKGNLNKHLKIHLGVKPFKCDVCPKAFLIMRDLHLHKWTHSKEKPFECEFCQKYFSRKTSLQNHLIIHTGEKPFACNICPKKFVRKGDLSKHIKGVHESTPGQFPCKTCGKGFKTKSALNYHTHTHSRRKPHICEICQTGFSRQNALNDHIRFHIGEKLYACNICGKRFGHKSHLRLHIMRHTGEKPYSCKQCPRTFVDPYSLRLHLQRIHL